MTVPVVWALARQYPDLRITVLSRPSSRPFFEGLAPNVNFMGADIKGEYHGLKGLNALYRRLVAKQFTAIADLHNVLRSEYLRMRFNMGHYRVEHINKHRGDRRRLANHKPSKPLKPLPTSFENYMDVFRRLGYPISLENLCFRSIFETADSPSDVHPTGDISQLPKEIGTKQTKDIWIGIAPFAAHKGKIYPVEKMQKVIEQLIVRCPNCRLFLFGRGPQEEQTFEQWTAQMPQCTFVGKVVENMHQELILMSHLDVMVSMDSANMHMASLTDTPVVSVWGATHPVAGFMGWHQNSANAVQVDLDCRPCSIYGNKPCRRDDYACLYQILPETIVEKITQVLTKKT